MNNQGLINDVLCSENSVSRFMWKSGQVKNGYAVPWEIQLVNTDPENFLWEKDKTAILVVKGGLYQISLGFFTTNRPTIQVLINGETVLSSLNSTFSVHHTHKLRKSSIIPGLTTNDYLEIPERSRVSVSFSGEDCFEGFIELKKKN
jgi:hypothetical protein